MLVRVCSSPVVEFLLFLIFASVGTQREMFVDVRRLHQHAEGFGAMALA